jgi:hypothetical protein
MKNPILTRAAIATALGLGLAGSFWAGKAFAADPKLDQANAAVGQAIVLLQAAQNDGVKPPFGGHRSKAVRLLQRAQKEIEAAKKWADDPPARAKKRGDKEKGKSTPGQGTAD